MSDLIIGGPGPGVGLGEVGSPAASTTSAVAGVARATALVLTLGISLVCFATPAKSAERALGAILTGKVALAGTARVAERAPGATVEFPSGVVAIGGTARSTERTPGALLTGTTSLSGQASSSTRGLGATIGTKANLIGTARHAERTRATAFSLAYAATQAKAVARGLGATLSSKTALVGQARETARGTGATLTTNVVAFLSGASRDSERAQGATLASTLPLTGTARASTRATASVNLVGIIPFAGTSRDSSRVRGAFLGGKTFLVGAGRAAHRTLGGTLKSALPLVGKSRTAPRAYADVTIIEPMDLVGLVRSTERARGAGLISRVAVLGTARTPAMATGRLQFAGTTAPLTGISRETDRALATGMALVRGATPSRAIERARGASLGLISGKVFVTGTARSIDRATGRLGLVYDVSPIRNSARVLGATLLSKRLLVGTVRESDRARGASLSFPGAPLAGTSRDIERARGASLGGKVALAGVVREQERLIGATLIHKTAIRGTAKASERATGALTFAGALQLDGGRAQGWPRVLGASLIQTTALRGTSRDTDRANGFLSGVAPLIGTVRTSERALGAAFLTRALLQGWSLGSANLPGAVLTIKFPILLQGTSCGTVAAQSAVLSGTVACAGQAVSSSLLPGAFLQSAVALEGTARSGYSRLVNGLNPVGAPYRVLESATQTTRFVATDRRFTMAHIPL